SVTRRGGERASVPEAAAGSAGTSVRACDCPCDAPDTPARLPAPPHERDRTRKDGGWARAVASARQTVATSLSAAREVAGGKDAALGDDRGDERRGRDVEGGIAHRHVRRRHRAPAVLAHLLRTSFFDRNVGSGRDREV